MTIRSHHEALLSTPSGVLKRVKEALGLSGVLEIKLTPDGIDLVRDMGDALDAEVFPAASDDIDTEFLLSSLDLTSYSAPDEHPFYSLYAATKELSKQGDVIGVVAPEPEVFAAWLGVDEPPSRLFGLEVRYVPGVDINYRVLVLRGKFGATFFTDATHGVAIDMGIQ